jgi:hypothetical protein
VAELARSMNNLASRLSNAARHHEALAASVEAVNLARELAAGKDDVHIEALARACGSLGFALRALWRLDEAAASFKEGIEILTPIVAKSAEAHARLYDALVTELIVTIEASDRPHEAAALRAKFDRKSSR